VAEQPTQAFTPPAELNPRELAWFLETNDHRRWPAIETKFGNRAWSLVAALIRDGGAVVRVSVTDIKNWKPRTLRLTHAWAEQAVDLLREMRGQPVPAEARAALPAIMDGIPELSDEATLLAVGPRDAPLRGPDGSRTGTSVWSVYDAAIRTAAYFLQHQRPDSPLTEREVAAHALPDSKEWTPARRAAFELLVGGSGTDRLSAMDHDIRVRGRLLWSVGPVAADAMRGCPWIGLPSGGIHVIGQIERDVRGVLVVENADVDTRRCTLVTKATARANRHPEAAGQPQKRGRTVSVTATTAPVRGLFRRRPWPARPRNPGSRTHSGRRQFAIGPRSA